MCPFTCNRHNPPSCYSSSQKFVVTTTDMVANSASLINISCASRPMCKGHQRINPTSVQRCNQQTARRRIPLGPTAKISQPKQQTQCPKSKSENPVLTMQTNHVAKIAAKWACKTPGAHGNPAFVKILVCKKCCGNFKEPKRPVIR